MPVENNGGVISGLRADWPLSGDPKSEGDNHIRNVKEMLKLQFPGENSLGFEKPITATEDEINFLGGATSNLQDQINAINAAAGWQRPQAMVEFNAIAGANVEIGQTRGCSAVWDGGNQYIIVTLDSGIDVDDQRIFLSQQDPSPLVSTTFYWVKSISTQFIITQRIGSSTLLAGRIMCMVFDAGAT